MNKIFYHKMDNDGRLSGAIARKYFETNKEPYELYPFNYYDNFPKDKLSKEDTIYFLDVVIQPYEKVKQLIDEGYNVIICDHHESFLKTNIHQKAKGNCSVKLAGCELTWNYFFPNTKMPEFVKLVGQYDRWDSSDPEWEEKILPFAWGIRKKKLDPVSSFENWNAFFNNNDFFVNEDLEYGKTILDFQRNQYKSFLKNYSFDAVIKQFPNVRFICFNSPGGNSLMFEEKWDHELYDAMMAFTFRGDCFICSLYTDKDIDLTPIATKFGGGGHAQACGFASTKFLVKKGKIYLKKAKKTEKPKDKWELKQEKSQE